MSADKEIYIKVRVSDLRQLYNSLLAARGATVHYNEDQLIMANDIIKKMDANIGYGLTALWSLIPPMYRSPDRPQL